jgi:predicted esterase
MRVITGERQPRTWRLGIVIASLAALAGGLAGAAVPAKAAVASPRTPTAPFTQHCNNVEFIGARGSGQAYDSGAGPFHGDGPEVWKMVSVVEKQLHAHGYSYGSDAVPYPADSVNDLKPSATELMFLENPMTADAELVYYYFHNVKKYLNSIAAGVSDTLTDVLDYHEVCPPTNFVLVGYSQGAMVMHQAEVQISAKHHSVLKSILGTLLLGDGNRVPNTKAKEFGTSPAKAEGIQTYLTPMSSHPDVPLPKTTANICNNKDIVCDFNLDQVLHFSASAKVHTSYAYDCGKTSCKYEPVLTTAANWVAGVVIAALRRLAG